MSYDEKKRNTILDYLVDVKKLAQSDRILNYAGANYSVTGKDTERPQARVLAQSDRILNYAGANYSVTGKDTEAAG